MKNSAQRQRERCSGCRGCRTGLRQIRRLDQADRTGLVVLPVAERFLASQRLSRCHGAEDYEKSCEKSDEPPQQGHNRRHRTFRHFFPAGAVHVLSDSNNRARAAGPIRSSRSRAGASRSRARGRTAQVRAIGCAIDDVAVCTCLIVVAVASATATPKAIMSAIKTNFGPMVWPPISISARPAYGQPVRRFKARTELPQPNRITIPAGLFRFACGRGPSKNNPRARA